jgi:hypothetical protein
MTEDQQPAKRLKQEHAPAADMSGPEPPAEPAGVEPACGTIPDLGVIPLPASASHIVPMLERLLSVYQVGLRPHSC